MKVKDTMPGPSGDLALQIIAMPRDTNPNGDIFAGWLISQMDLAAATTAGEISKGRVVTVAVERMEFLSPVRVGDQIRCYTRLLDTGRSSMKIEVEVWIKDSTSSEYRKVTNATFIFVAVKEDGGIRTLPSSLSDVI